MTLGLESLGHDGAIPGLLPASATVYHKIGLLYQPWNVWNDAGIVVFTGDDGQERAYAISYLGQYSSSIWESMSHGAELSRIAFDYFSRKY
jgi:hypothetical protein